MQNAVIRAVPALVAIEFQHGFEIIPTTVDGKRTQWASVDADGAIVAWASHTPPEFDNGAWCLDCDDLAAAGMVGPDDGTVYPHAADSLRRINPSDILAG